MRHGLSLGSGWLAAIVSSLIFYSPAMAQSPGVASVKVERRPANCAQGPTCGVFLVNNSKTDRAVATVVVSTESEIHMQDFAQNTFPLRTPMTQVVLLFPGQELRMPASIDLHGPGGQIGPATRRYSYVVAGSYVPRPDLMDLPPGRARDWVRILDMDFGNYPCALGAAHVLRVRNVHIARSVAVSFQNRTPTRRTTPQTLYLAPGEDGFVGCANEWQNIEFIGAEFSG